MPGQRCAILGCNNNRFAIKDSNIKYHSFPKGNDAASLSRRNQWLRKCKRLDLNHKTSTVCSIHFTNDDFERDLQNELLGLPLRRKLKNTAVPTLHIKVTNGKSSARYKTFIKNKCELETNEIVQESTNLQNDQHIVKSEVTINEVVEDSSDNKMSLHNALLALPLRENIQTALPTLTIKASNEKLPVRHKKIVKRLQKKEANVQNSQCARPELVLICTSDILEDSSHKEINVENAKLDLSLTNKFKQTSVSSGSTLKIEVPNGKSPARHKRTIVKKLQKIAPNIVHSNQCPTEPETPPPLNEHYILLNKYQNLMKQFEDYKSTQRRQIKILHDRIRYYKNKCLKWKVIKVNCTNKKCESKKMEEEK